MDRNSGIYSHMDCFLMTMELVYTSMNMDFSTMFVNAWRFDYNPINKDLAVYSFNEYMKKINSKYLEVSRKKIAKEDVNLQTLKEYIDTYKTVVMTIDCIDCPWHRGYLQASIWHACALTGYSDEGIWCTDPFIKGYEQFLIPESVFEYGEFYYYAETKIVKNIDIDNLLGNIASNEVVIHEGIKMIDIFKNDICMTETAMELYDIPQDIYLCTITNGLKAIADYRFQLAYLLEDLYKKQACEDERINQIYMMLYDVSDVWLKVQHMVVRLFYEPRRLEKTKVKIQTYISDIIEIEKKILSEIKDYVIEN
ncbi:hypothetical protein AN1V17_06190 [Vallitalea sediminicola]